MRADQRPEKHESLQDSGEQCAAPNLLCSNQSPLAFLPVWMAGCVACSAISNGMTGVTGLLGCLPNA